MAMKIIMTDGTKSINPLTDDRPGVWTSTSDTKNEARSTRLVPSVFAGIQARMQAMADLPFTVYNMRDEEVDNSDNYKNAIGFMPYPSRTFSLTEGALAVAGRCYWYKGLGARTGAVKELKYWLPMSVTLDASKAQQGEVWFRRQGVANLFPAEQVLYMWGIDPDVELGPPTVWPLESAIIAAQANGAITTWVADYMRRGAIKAMLLMVEGMPPQNEVDRMEGWFNKFMSGARGLAWKVFNAQGVKPTIVGDGLEALKDLGISKELRYDIHQALGTRHLLEDENFATADAREKQFYTITIMPDARLIQYGVNEQVLHAKGYHLEFEPERLEIFQTNEAEQTKSFGDLFAIFKEVLPVEIAFKLASEKLDYQFTDEQQRLIAQGIAEKKTKAQEVAAQLQPKPVVPPAPMPEPVQPPANKALVELDRWEDKVSKAGKMVTWHAVELSVEMCKAIKAGTMTFEQARAELSQPENVDSIRALADSINAAVEAYVPA